MRVILAAIYLAKELRADDAFFFDSGVDGGGVVFLEAVDEVL